MNRIERISSILIQLQSKRVVTAREIAERFNISLRTVYRDISCLEEAGIPVCSEPGVGYYLVKGYHLPPVIFTREEAVSLLIGEKMMRKLTDKSTQQAFQDAIFKIKAILGSKEKDYLASLSENIEIQDKHFVNPNTDYQFLKQIEEAIVSNRVLQIDYFSDNTRSFSSRTIEPIGLYYYSSRWHLISFCLLRKDYRDFRVDRIKKLEVHESHFNRERRLTLQECIRKMLNSENLIPIKILFRQEFIKYMGETKFYFGYTGEKQVDQEWVEVSFLYPFLEYFSRWLLSFTDAVRIVDPPELKPLMQEISRQAYNNFNLNFSDTEKFLTLDKSLLT